MFRNGLLPALLGGVAVISALPINFAAFAVWVALLSAAATQPGKAGGKTR